MTVEQTDSLHLTPAELQAGLDTVRAAPADDGTLELIVRRPAVGEREPVDEAELDLELGLLGDSWSTRGRSGGRPANTSAQVTVMNARAAALVARRSRPSTARRRPALRRPRPGRGEPAAGDAARGRRRRPRGHRRAAHRLQEVQRALRPRGVAVRQLARGSSPQPARDQHACRHRRRCPGRRRRARSSSQAPRHAREASSRAARTPRRCRARG